MGQEPGDQWKGRLYKVYNPSNGGMEDPWACREQFAAT
jgi:hypothetical protein